MHLLANIADTCIYDGAFLHLAFAFGVPLVAALLILFHDRAKKDFRSLVLRITELLVGLAVIAAFLVGLLDTSISKEDGCYRMNVLIYIFIWACISLILIYITRPGFERPLKKKDNS